MLKSEYKNMRRVLMMKNEAVNKAKYQVDKLRGSSNRSSFIIALEIYETELREYENLKSLFERVMTEEEC